MQNCIIFYKITPSSIKLYYEFDNNKNLKIYDPFYKKTTQYFRS